VEDALTCGPVLARWRATLGDLHVASRTQAENDFEFGWENIDITFQQFHFFFQYQFIRKIVNSLIKASRGNLTFSNN
jgi:hypothetical protein